MTTDLETTIQYYKDLILYQYINAPKALATIDLLINQAVVDLLPIAVRDAFDLNTAVGDQLDVLGEYIGLSRVVPFQIERDYFSLDDYNTPLSDPTGFTSYLNDTLNRQGSTYLYVFAQNSWSTLEDSEYRLLLKLKVVLNTSQATFYEIATILNDFFGSDIVFCDQQDMSISYFVVQSIERIISIAYDAGLLPKPMGVLLSGVFSVLNPDAVWGFTDYTYDTGFDVGFSNYTDGLAWAYLLNYLDRIRPL